MYLLAIGAGALNPAQAGANAELKKTWNQPVFAAAAVYISGLLGVLFIQLIVRQPWPATDKLSQTPWWAWLGGLLSIGATMAGLTFAQRMGAGVFTGLSVTASLVTSVVLDHFGWIGFKVHPASWPRIAGCGLMIAGLWIISKF